MWEAVLGCLQEGGPLPSPSDPRLAALSPQLCRATRCLSAVQEAAVVEALEVTAAVEAVVAAAAGATAPVGVVAEAMEEATEGVPEGAVEVVMGPAVEETMEEAAKVAASLGAEAAAPPNCRSSKHQPTPPTSTLWSRNEGFYDPSLLSPPHALLIPSYLPFPDGSQQFCQ